MKVNKKFFLTGLCASLSFFAPQVLAQTATTTFDVVIEIVASCDISVAGAANLDFGQQGYSNSNIDQSVELNVTCTNGSPYEIALNEGVNASTAGDVTTRRMAGVDTVNAADFVPYGLFTDAGRISVWGTNTGDVVQSTGLGEQQIFTIYGRVPSTNFTVGNYSDTVTATVTF